MCPNWLWSLMSDYALWAFSWFIRSTQTSGLFRAVYKMDRNYTASSRNAIRPYSNRRASFSLAENVEQLNRSLDLQDEEEDQVINFENRKKASDLIVSKPGGSSTIVKSSDWETLALNKPVTSLSIISFVYALSWLPINLYRLVFHRSFVWRCCIQLMLPFILSN